MLENPFADPSSLEGHGSRRDSSNRALSKNVDVLHFPRIRKRPPTTSLGTPPTPTTVQLSNHTEPIDESEPTKSISNDVIRHSDTIEDVLQALQRLVGSLSSKDNDRRQQPPDRISHATVALTCTDQTLTQSALSSSDKTWDPVDVTVLQAASTDALSRLNQCLQRHTHILNLQALNLSQNHLTSTAAISIATIVHSQRQSLQTLNLADNTLGPDGLEQIVQAIVVGSAANGEALHNPTSNTTLPIVLERLNVSNNKIGPKGANPIAFLLRHNTSIRTLLLAMNRLGTKTVKKIVPELLAHNQHNIDKEGDEDHEYYGNGGDIGTIRVLQHLDLSYNQISDRGAHQLASVLQERTTLQSLDLTYNKIGPSGARSIADALFHNHHSRLAWLNLSLNRIGPEGAKSFAPVLKYSHTLKQLFLSSVASDEAKDRDLLESDTDDSSSPTLFGIQSLLSGLESSEATVLQVLDLSWNSLRDSAASLVASILRHNATLQYLNLASNALTSKGIVSIVQALTYDIALKELNLVGNQADDVSIPYLVSALCNMAWLSFQIHTDHNNFSATGKAQLQAAYTFRDNLQSWLGTLLGNIERLARRRDRKQPRKIPRLNIDLTAQTGRVGDHEVLALSQHLAQHGPIAVTTIWIDGGDADGRKGKVITATKGKSGPAVAQDPVSTVLTSRGVVQISNDLIRIPTSPTVTGSTLERLYLHDCVHVGNEGVAAIAQALLSDSTLSHCRLRLLSLVNCHVTHVGAVHLAKVIRQQTALHPNRRDSDSPSGLVRINLKSNRIGNDGLLELLKAIFQVGESASTTAPSSPVTHSVSTSEAPPSSTSHKSRYHHNHHPRNHGHTTSTAKAPHSTTGPSPTHGSPSAFGSTLLQSLNVSDNGITDAGLFLLRTLSLLSLASAQLEELHLANNDISDLGALELCQLLCCHSKTRSSSSGQTLTSKRALHCLTWLDVSCNRISPAGSKALRLFLPARAILEADQQRS